MSIRITPSHCIVPPHMLQEIEQHGSQAQREAAARTLSMSEQVREQRTQVMAAIEREATPAATPGKKRSVYNAQQGSSLPGTLVRSEGDAPFSDDAVNEAYDGSGDTYELFSEVYGRDSLDGQGLQLDSTVHFGQGYDTAFWNGFQMVYGDGDEDLPEAERLFNRFTRSLDVIGHELTHGVTSYTAKLEHRDQPGALNESFSDVFGSLVKQHMRKQTVDQADWIIGEGLFTSNVNGQGIRSMKAPGTAYDDPVLGKDPQPGHMRDYKNVSYDNGGVHINSGIPNRAFYIAATEMGGHAWDRAGRIWYVALRDRLHRTADFQYAANAILDTSARLYGAGSPEYNAVWKGWDAVGITLERQEPQPPPRPQPQPKPAPRKKPFFIISIILAVIAAVGIALRWLSGRNK